MEVKLMQSQQKWLNLWYSVPAVRLSHATLEGGVLHGQPWPVLPGSIYWDDLGVYTVKTREGRRRQCGHFYTNLRSESRVIYCLKILNH